MKEFYLYTLKPEYISRFVAIEPNLEFFKGETRPAICLKDKRGHNWLLPMSSLDPKSPNYLSRIRRTIKQENLEKQLQKKLPVKAIMRFPDLTGLEANPGFESLIQFYKAIPVKDYLTERYTHTGVHIKARLTTDKKVDIKKNFLGYMRRYFNGEVSGFLFAYQKTGADISEWQYNARGIKRELYREYYRQQGEQKERKAGREARAQIKEHKKELKDQYKEAVEQGLAELGVPEGTASPDSLFLTELVEKNCSQPDKPKTPPAAAEIRSATKTPEIPQKNAQEKHK